VLKKVTTTLFCIFAVFAHTSAQSLLEKKVTVTVNNKSVAELLKQLEEQADCHFMYEDKILDTKRLISVSSNGESMHSVLRQILPDQSIAFSCMRQQVIIHKKKESAQPPLQQENRKQTIVYTPVYDTISLIKFDTVVKNITDTTVVIIYDTVVNYAEKTQPKSNIEYVISTSTFFASSTNDSDSLSILRNSNEQVLPIPALEAMIYRNFGTIAVGLGANLLLYQTKLDYNITKTSTIRTVDTVYYNAEYYDYFLSTRKDSTAFGDEVHTRYTDSILVTEKIPQTIERTSSVTKKYSFCGKWNALYAGVPITVRKQLFGKNKWSMHANIGAEFLFEILYRGPKGGEGIAPDFALKKTAINGMVVLSAHYAVSEKIGIDIHGKGKIGTHSIYANSSGIPVFAGFGIGMIFY